MKGTVSSNGRQSNNGSHRIKRKGPCPPYGTLSADWASAERWPLTGPTPSEKETSDSRRGCRGASTAAHRSPRLPSAMWWRGSYRVFKRSRAYLREGAWTGPLMRQGSVGVKRSGSFHGVCFGTGEGRFKRIAGLAISSGPSRWDCADADPSRTQPIVAAWPRHEAANRGQA